MAHETSAQVKRNLEVTLGDSGTSRYGGYFQEEPNIDWRDSKRADIIEEMRRTDGAVSAVLKGIKAPILSTEWSIFYGDDSDKGKKIKHFVEHNIFGMRRNWKEFLREGFSFLDFGHYTFEMIFEIKKGMIYLMDLEPRIPSSIESWPVIDGVRHVRQRIETDEADKLFSTVDIPEHKLLILTNDKEGDDVTGQSILRPAYIHWKYKNVLYRISGIAADRYGVGIPVVKLPEDYGEDEKEEAEEMAKHVRSNEKSYMVLPQGFEFEIATPGSNSKDGQIDSLIDHHNRMIMVSTLEQFLALGSDGVGSLALSNDQSSFFLRHVEDKAHYFASQFNVQVIRRLVDLNFGPQETYPELRFTPLGTKDVKQMAEVLKLLKEAELLGEIDGEMKKWVRDNFKLPELTDEQLKREENTPPKPKEEKEELAEKPLKIRRKLTLQEQMVDFERLNEDFNKLETALEDELAGATAEEIDKFVDALKRKLDAGDIAGVAALTLFVSGKVKSALDKIIKESYHRGKISASKERNLTRPTTPSQTKKIMALDVSGLTEDYVRELERDAKSFVKDAAIAGAASGAVAVEVKNRMKNRASGLITNISGTVVGQYVNRGRNAVFQDNITKITSFQRSEVLDSSTCDMCLSLDERVVKASDPMAQMDIVHSHCRGLWVPIFAIDDEQPAVTGIPSSISKNFDTVDGRPTVNSFKQLKKPINSQNEKVQKIVRDKLGT